MITGRNNFDRLHLQVLGYQPWLFPNILPVFYPLALLSAICLGAILLILIFSKRGKRKRNILRLLPKFSNVLARFTYFNFLELSLCAVLALTLSFTARDKFTQFREMLSAGILLIALLTFLGLLLFSCRNASMHSDMTFEKLYDHKLTQFFCCWQKRQLRENLLGNDDDHLVTEAELAALELFSQNVKKRQIIEQQVLFQLELKTKRVDTVI